MEVEEVPVLNPTGVVTTTASSSKTLEGTPGFIGPQIRLPTILDGKFFKVLNVDGDKIRAKCTICVKSKTIDGFKNTSNFTTHLKRVHPKSLLEHEKYLKEKKDQHKKEENAAQAKRSQSPPATLHKYFKPDQVRNQAQADHLITDFVIESMSPLSVVDAPAFRKLVRCLNKDVNVMSSKVLKSRIVDTCFAEKQKIIAELKDSKYVCCTADIWSAGKRSFLGVTVHFMNKHLERVSYAIACRRFSGTHSFDSYEIPRSKIVCVVTDNGSNFVKAFKEFGKDLINEDHQTTQPEEIDSEVEEQDTVVNLPLQPTIETNLAVELPPLHRCAAHTLNLVLSKDSQKIPIGKGSPQYTRLLRSSMGKCVALWNKGSKPKSAEIIFEISGLYLKAPNATRWNSTFDAMVRILKLEMYLEPLCSALKLPQFQRQEIEFCQQYVAVVTSVAAALDILQGEKICMNNDSSLLMGTLAPAILSVRQKLVDLEVSTTEVLLVKPLVSALLHGIEVRFKHIIDLDLNNPKLRELIFASACQPYFKLRWLPVDKFEQCKSAFMEEALKFRNDAGNDNKNASATEKTCSKFFNFPSERSSNVNESNNNVHLECLEYLRSTDTDIQLLHRFPAIKNMFLRYNTAIPSSAPVERFFSYGGMILSPKRRNLGDKMFENYVLLKNNSSN